MNASALRKLWRERRTSLLPSEESGVWRFREILPDIAADKIITIGEGNTPVYELPHCAKRAGVRWLYAKHQGMNPTGSFKDTGMTVAASFARQAGYQWVACASTGNTSASMAAYAARGGLHSLVLIPDGKISWSKLSQSLDYGAVTCQLKTDFDGCVRVLNEVVERMPVYLLNSVNPYRVEGQKTAAYELAEQFGWEPPDHIIVPGGNLANSSAIGKALREMKQLGLISRLPKVSVIQAEGANPLVRTIRETKGKTLVPVHADTMATAIRIGNPASWKKALRVIEETEGTVEEVSEVEIAVAKAEIGAEGVGCEPASAVTLAGLKKLVKRGFVSAGEPVVLVLTGHLLKDSEFTLRFHRGDLFTGTSHESESRAAMAEQRAPLVLEANVDAVVDLVRAAEH
jgi:threonine synthase